MLVEAFDASAVSIKTLGAGEAIAGGIKGRTIISRAGDISSDLLVYYTAKGSAKPGADYLALSGRIVIPAGKTNVKLKVVALKHRSAHGSRVLTIKLLPAPDGSYDPAPGADGVAKLRLIGSSN